MIRIWQIRNCHSETRQIEWEIFSIVYHRQFCSSLLINAVQRWSMPLNALFVLPYKTMYFRCIDSIEFQIRNPQGQWCKCVRVYIGMLRSMFLCVCAYAGDCIRMHTRWLSSNDTAHCLMEQQQSTFNRKQIACTQNRFGAFVAFVHSTTHTHIQFRFGRSYVDSDVDLFSLPLVKLLSRAYCRWFAEIKKKNKQKTQQYFDFVRFDW